MTDEVEAEVTYKGKALKDFDLWELEQANYEFNEAEKKRETASKHVKFNEDRVIDNTKVPKMNMPPANPEYLKLKLAIKQEFEKRKNNA